MMKRYVPCPDCGHFQYLEMKNIVWDKEMRQGVFTHLPETSKLKCLGCSSKIDHKHKRRMDDLGEWRQTQVFFCCDEWQDPAINRNWKHLGLDSTSVFDDKKGYACCKECNLPAEYNKSMRIARGYHIHALYSFQPNTTWSNASKKMIEAMGKPDLMKTFVNTWLGEPFKEKQIKLSETSLLSKTEDYTLVPDCVQVMIMTVDTQGSWLQYVIRGWAKGETSYGLDQGKVIGDPMNKSVWDELYKISKTKYEKENGKTMEIYMMLIDSGGNRTQYVYDFVSRPECNKFAWACKGSSLETKDKDNDIRPYAEFSKTKVAPVPLIYIATNRTKDLIYDRLQLKIDEYGYIHFNKNFDEEYFLQLTCEKKVFVKNKLGYMVQKYKAQRERNEAIDIECYNLAAIKLLQKAKLIDFSI